MISSSLFLLVVLYQFVISGISHPLLSTDVTDGRNTSNLTLQSTHSNTSLQSSALLSQLNIGDHIEDLNYQIPGAQPRRYLQMSYNRNSPIDPGAFKYVITTISAQVQNHISLHGDGPMVPSPWNYYTPACFSSTTSLPYKHPKRMTFGMLNEIMLALRVALEQQQRFYSVFYDLMDENNVPWGEGSLLTEEEPPYGPGTAISKS